jgi:hypothetical protein
MVRARKMPPSSENGDPKATANITAIADVGMNGDFAPGSAKGG